MMSEQGIDPAFLSAAATCYRESPVVYACINILRRGVMREGLSVTRGGKEATPAYYEEYITPHIAPFVRSCVREITLYGFVAYRVIELESGLSFPEIIPGNQLSIRVGPIRGRKPREFRAEIRGTREEVPFFHAIEDYDTETNAIDSPVRRAMNMCNLERVLIANAEVSDTRAAHTPLVLENTAGAGNFWAYKNYAPDGGSTFRGGEQLENEMATEIFQRSFAGPVEKVDEKLISMQETYVSMLNTIGGLESSVFKDARMRTTGEKGTPDLPKMNLPPHTRPTNVVFPNTRADITRIIDQNMSLVCTALGVPVAMLQPTRVYNEAALVHEGLLAETIREMRSKIMPVLMEAFSKSTTGDDLVMGILTGQEKYKKSAVIRFREARGRLQDLVKHYEAGLVPLEVVQRRMASLHDFDPKEYQKQSERFIAGIPPETSEEIRAKTQTSEKAPTPTVTSSSASSSSAEEEEEEEAEKRRPKLKRKRRDGS